MRVEGEPLYLEGQPDGRMGGDLVLGKVAPAVLVDEHT
jgi:hypothetical protein